MNENVKTITLVLVAAGVVALALVTRPRPPAANTEDLVGQPLFPALSDPLKARRMRIVTFDEGTSRVREFEVAQNAGVWSLPSHKNYPADAKEQMAAAAGSLVDLEVLGVVSHDARDHELYGVIEPDAGKDQLGQKGIGKLIVLEDESNKPLARLIVGKADRSGREDQFASQHNELRFVRVPGQDPVYRVALATDKFGTNFADWIETDLLKINPFDIRQVRLRDYSVSEGVTSSGEVVPMLSQRADMRLDYDDRAGQWTLEELVEYKKNKPEKVAASANEQLNTARLNEMKDALDNLEIIDVARKPAQMSANLQAGREFLNDEEALRDLTRRGFLPVPTADNKVEIVSNDGEVTVSMKDGVEYLLRFGGIAGIDSSPENEDKSPGGTNSEATDKSGKAADPSRGGGGGLSRYLMVMARFNPELIPKPDLAAVPEIKKAPLAPAGGKAGEAAKAGSKAGDAKAGTASADSQAPTEEVDLEALEAERDRIEKENRRKQDAYDEQVKAGEQRAKELNARFADWYYVINDETYRNIHLGKADVLQKKAAEGAASPPAANPFDLRGGTK